jgi:DNA-binding transcriptional LysR family regulator
MQCGEMDWDDIRFFLAVARTGSTVGAARALGVNQTTVARRVAELEAAVGAQLFERGREGYRLCPGAEALLSIGETVEGGVQAFAELAGAMSRGVDTIRVTTNEPLANTILAPAIRAFRTSYPDVRIDLVITTRQLNLARGEADIALRAAPMPTDAELVGRRVGDAHWGVYCSHDYARFHGAPKDVEGLADHALMVLPDPSGSRLGQISSPRSLERRDTANELCIAARAGIGVVSLPCVLGDGQSDFQRCFLQAEPITPVWLIYHERLRGSAEVRAFLDCVVQNTQAARDALRGAITPATA